MIGCVPLYLKTHSYGEYVFDHDWARAHLAFSPTGYYPKLQVCLPPLPLSLILSCCPSAAFAAEVRQGSGRSGVVSQGRGKR